MGRFHGKPSPPPSDFQWVVTVPWPRRWLLARRSDLARGVLRIALSEIEALLSSRGSHSPRRGGRTGSITMVQRFGSALNLNLHFHILVLDGQYVRDPRTGRLVWTRARTPRTEQIERLVERLAERSEAWLARQGFGPDEPLCEDPDDAQAQIQFAAVQGRSALRQGLASSSEPAIERAWSVSVDTSLAPRWPRAAWSRDPTARCGCC
jgi:hypothetical protein